MKRTSTFRRTRIRTRTLQCTSALALLVLGCGGPEAAPDGDDGSEGLSLDVPEDQSVAGLTAFFDAESYRSESWESESDGPRAATTTISPHGRVRVWYNHALRVSAAAKERPFAIGSMAAKEFFTESDELVGHAAVLKTETGYLYFCTASEPSRCFAAQPAGEVYHSTGSQSCSCHGLGTIATEYSIPPP